MILIELSALSARPSVMPCNGTNETAIQLPCGEKAESSGCPRSRSQQPAMNRATLRGKERPNERRE